MKNIIDKSAILAFGDSFTVGSNATNNNGYVQRLKTFIGGILTNYGSGSTLSTYSAKKGLEVLPEGYRTQLVTWMAGLNDIRGGGSAAIPKIKGNLRSFLAASLINDCRPASSLKRTGTWTALASDWGGKAFACGGTPIYTSGSLTASLEYEFYGDNVVIGAYRTNGTTGNYRDLSISVDGGTPQIFTLWGNTNEIVSYDALIIRGLGEGIHSLKIMPTTTLAYTVVDYVGTLVPPNSQPPIFVFKIPYLLNWAQYSSIATQAICDSANTAIGEVVAEFDGLDIEFIDTNKYYNPTTQCSSDGIHPTDAGHQAICDAATEQITLV